MKRPYLIILILVAVALSAYFILFERPGKHSHTPDQPLSFTGNGDPFNRSFDGLLAAYLELKEALVESDSVKADQAAARVSKAADSLKVNEIGGDSTGTIPKLAETLILSLKGSCDGLAGEKNLQDKRKEFEMVSDIIYNLARTVRYTGHTLYYQHCPMAFDNRGAYWLSDDPVIRNPYFGNKMLRCGTVEDSLGYATSLQSK